MVKIENVHFCRFMRIRAHFGVRIKVKFRSVARCGIAIPNLYMRNQYIKYNVHFSLSLNGIRFELLDMIKVDSRSSFHAHT